ncbi:MAG: peptidyl-prolyl cis-trans isomerase, partial [Planctomycetes bacterium]|nr:peptidyl-prolyl cis-trans isomerase [Planctomycetota bacterium]
VPPAEVAPMPSPGTEDEQPIPPKPSCEHKPISALDDDDFGKELIAPGVFDDTRNEKLLGDDNDAKAIEVAPVDPSMFGPEIDDNGEESLLDQDESVLLTHKIAATVNGEKITEGELRVLLNGAVDELKMRLGKAAFTPKGQAIIKRKKIELRDKVLATMIDRVLIMQAAGEEGIVPSADEVYSHAEAIRAMGGLITDNRQLIKQAKLDLVLNRVMDRHAPMPTDIAPAEVKAYYEKFSDRFMQPRRARLRSVIIYLDREGRQDQRSAIDIAKDVVEQIQHRIPFTEIVAKFSEGPAAADGGLLDFGGGAPVPTVMLAGQVQKELDNAKQGEILGPIYLAGAVSFFQVETLRPAEPRPFSEVSPQIAIIIRQLAARDAFDRWLETLRNRAEISINR